MKTGRAAVEVNMRYRRDSRGGYTNSSMEIQSLFYSPGNVSRALTMLSCLDFSPRSQFRCEVNLVYESTLTSRSCIVVV